LLLKAQVVRAIPFITDPITRMHAMDLVERIKDAVHSKR
jgi:hypothetical protein